MRASFFRYSFRNVFSNFHRISILLLLGLLSSCGPLHHTTRGQWHDVNVITAPAGDSLRLHPTRYRLVKLKDSHLSDALLRAGDSDTEASLIWLPLPGEGASEFWIWKNNTVSPQLVEKYPGLQTYQGRQKGGPATLRLENGNKGLQVMVLGNSQTWYLAPYSLSDNLYMVFTKNQLPGGSRLDEPAGN